MYIDLTPEQKTLRQTLRRYFEELMTPDVRAKVKGMEGGKLYRELVRKIGRDGWLGVGWPKEFGGGGMTMVEQMIFLEEQRRSGAPFPFVTVSTVGPALIDHGSPEQKKEYLPRILAGECHFSIGYSEPNAGTDLASLQTLAVQDGDDWVINGTKMFTSGANDTDYIWLAARTDPKAPKHKGITIFIVPADSKGFSASLIHTVGGSATAMSYYENVRVPKENIVGGLHGGWKLITTQLNHERVGLAAFGSACYARTEKVMEWARDTETPEGGKMIDLPWVQHNLAEVFARIEAMKLMNWRMAAALETGFVNPADASAVKVYGTEVVLEVYRLLQEIIGPAALVAGGSPAAQINGEIEHESRLGTINTFGGGVNEIQREIVSMAGLRMPRVPR
ncbi:MAG: acyl-CoA dehydrogenase family protein [Spirochaetaceae bacterium]|nr:acyl-CoA dehydrogenase family protein [Myxococcales bacterium]MCB9724929.1 acyl-CoA dehydrogenase family protein [Spirochaetaceae bacterium]